MLLKQHSATCNKPGGEAMIQLSFVIFPCFISHDLKVQDEHDHHAILVLHWHHIHHAQETLTCRENNQDPHTAGVDLQSSRT